MKATKFLSLAALALTFAACSSDDNELTQQPAEQPGEITITATIDASDGAATRALGIDGDNIASNYVVGEKIAVLFEYNSEQVQRDAEVKSLDGTTAKVEFTIPADLTGSQTATLVYPATAVNTTKNGADVATALATQDGTIANCPEVRTGTGTLDASAKTLTVGSALAAQNAIFKLTLKDIDGTGNVSATSVIISDQNGVVTTVTTSATNEMYVALPTTATTLKFLVTGSDSKKYFNMASGLSLGANYYQSIVKLATVGDVILSTGKCAKAGTSGAVAKICYLGDETGESAYNYTNGLALALSDANGGSACIWKTSQTDAGHTKQPSSTFTEESGLQYNDATHNSDTYPAFKAAIAYNSTTAAPTGCSKWFLASGYQWQKMAGAEGVGGYNNLGLQEYSAYWSSSESDAECAWFFDDGYWMSNGKDGGPFRVRACLAF